MGLTPTYYLADFMTGDLYGETLPLEAVSLSSSLQPGRFSATLDMRKLGSLGDGYRVMDLLKHGKCTLVPVLEGISDGSDSPPTSTAMGEWWVSVVRDAPPSPLVSLSGPQFSGYASEVLLGNSWAGNLDPIRTAREMLATLYSTSQDVAVNLGSAASTARIEVDAAISSDTVWSAISALQDGEDAGFEWQILTGLDLDGWAPRRVTRTLSIAGPTLRYHRLGITLELTAPGEGPGTVTGVAREASEHRTGSTVYGLGAGRGEDQVRTYVSRDKVPGEPAKNRSLTDSTAMTVPILRRRVRAALGALSPELQVWDASMPTGLVMPGVGQVFSWRMDPQWTRPGEDGLVRVASWSWKSGQNLDAFELELVEG